jgi:hypothetical protein
VRFTSGVSKEWWTKSTANRGAGMLTGSDWAYQTQLLRGPGAPQDLHRDRLRTGDDWPAIDYARASFLLFARGGRSAFSYAPLCGVEPSAPRWRAAVGAPSGPPVENGGVWRRQFANGLVLVNPTSAATVTVPLGGRYVQPNGTVVTSVVLGPHTGLTLRRS